MSATCKSGVGPIDSCRIKCARGHGFECVYHALQTSVPRCVVKASCSVLSLGFCQRIVSFGGLSRGYVCYGCSISCNLIARSSHIAGGGSDGGCLRPYIGLRCIVGCLRSAFVSGSSGQISLGIVSGCFCRQNSRFFFIVYTFGVDSGLSSCSSGCVCVEQLLVGRSWVRFNGRDVCNRTIFSKFCRCQIGAGGVAFAGGGVQSFISCGKCIIGEVKGSDGVIQICVREIECIVSIGKIILRCFECCIESNFIGLLIGFIGFQLRYRTFYFRRDSADGHVVEGIDRVGVRHYGVWCGVRCRGICEAGAGCGSNKQATEVTVVFGCFH